MEKGKAPAELKRSLSSWNFFTIGFGACIGSGWVLLVGAWVIKGGGPMAAILAFLVGAIFLLPMSLVFGEMAAAIPQAGGTVIYINRAFGKRTSYYVGWLMSLSRAILCPWECLAISVLLGERMSDFFPILKAVKLYTILGSNVYLLPTILALCVGGYVSYLNWKGASSAAKLQGFVFKILIIGAVVAMISSLIKGSPSHMLPLFQQVQTDGGSTKAGNMFVGMISVLVLVPFFLSGFDTPAQQAEEAAEGMNWNKFAKMIGLALVCVSIFYMATIYAFSTIVPWTTFVTYTVPSLAALKTISIVLYVVMLCIVIMSPMGPMNANFGSTGRVLMAMSRKNQIPQGFSKVHPTHGTPIVANIILCVLTLCGPFLGRNMLLPLTDVSSLGFIVSYTMVCFSCWKLRRTEPDLKRPYRVPGGLFSIIFACVAGLIIIALMVLPFSPAALTPLEWVITGAWIVVGIILSVIAKKEAPPADSASLQE